MFVVSIIVKGEGMQDKTLNHSESLDVETMLTDILNNMEALEVTIEKNRLDGACLELFERVVEAGDKWHFNWEENYCE